MGDWLFVCVCLQYDIWQRRQVKKMNIKKILAGVIPGAIFLASMPKVSAHCPLCTGAVIAGGIGAKYLGLDVSIVGVFAGAASISMGLWIARKIKRYFKFQSALIVLLSYLSIVLPSIPLLSEKTYLMLSLFGSPGSLFNRVYFVDKLLLGSIIGSVFALLAYNLHLYIKAKRGKVLIPYQGVILTLLFVALAGFLTYLLVR